MCRNELLRHIKKLLRDDLRHGKLTIRFFSDKAHLVTLSPGFTASSIAGSATLKFIRHTWHSEIAKRTMLDGDLARAYVDFF
jgi:hypothetical protein